MGIIADTGSGGLSAGSILSLADALEEYPDRGLAIYNRVSSWGQAGVGKVNLKDKDRGVLEAVRGIAAPGRLKRVPISGVEEGKLSVPRPKLLEAAEYAAGRNLILVAGDLSRFIRPEQFNHVKNPNAWPTDEEFERLRAMTGGVILATVESPLLTARERQSKATKRTKKHGRPPELSYQRALAILYGLGFRDEDSGRWETPIAFVAKRHKVTESKIKRLLDMVVPGELFGMDEDWRLKDSPLAARTFVAACKLARQNGVRWFGSMD